MVFVLLISLCVRVSVLLQIFRRIFVFSFQPEALPASIWLHCLSLASPLLLVLFCFVPLPVRFWFFFSLFISILFCFLSFFIAAIGSFIFTFLRRLLFFGCRTTSGLASSGFRGPDSGPGFRPRLLVQDSGAFCRCLLPLQIYILPTSLPFLVLIISFTPLLPSPYLILQFAFATLGFFFFPFCSFVLLLRTRHSTPVPDSGPHAVPVGCCSSLFYFVAIWGLLLHRSFLLLVYVLFGVQKRNPVPLSDPNTAPKSGPGFRRRLPVLDSGPGFRRRSGPDPGIRSCVAVVVACQGFRHGMGAFHFNVFLSRSVAHVRVFRFSFNVSVSFNRLPKSTCYAVYSWLSRDVRVISGISRQMSLLVRCFTGRLQPMLHPHCRELLREHGPLGARGRR